MRRITFAVIGTISALILLFSYHTSTNSQVATQAPLPTGATGSSGDSSSSASAPPATNSPAPSSSSSGSSSSSSGTYTGEAAGTRWGTVQVQITVKNGKITKSEAVQYPANNPRDQEINAYAVPQLDSEAVRAQSGSIDAVSGATVTSGGYIQSLQSAVDKANL